MLQLVELFNNLYDYVFDTVAKGSASSTFWDDIPFELANLLFGLIVTYFFSFDWPITQLSLFIISIFSWFSLIYFGHAVVLILRSIFLSQSTTGIYIEIGFVCLAFIVIGCFLILFVASRILNEADCRMLKWYGLFFFVIFMLLIFCNISSDFLYIKHKAPGTFRGMINLLTAGSAFVLTLILILKKFCGVIRDTFFNNVNPPNGHHPNQQQVVAAEQPAPPVHDIPAPVVLNEVTAPAPSNENNTIVASSAASRQLPVITSTPIPSPIRHIVNTQQNRYIQPGASISTLQNYGSQISQEQQQQSSHVQVTSTGTIRPQRYIMNTQQNRYIQSGAFISTLQNYGSQISQQQQNISTSLTTTTTAAARGQVERHVVNNPDQPQPEQPQVVAAEQAAVPVVDIPAPVVSNELMAPASTDEVNVSSAVPQQLPVISSTPIPSPVRNIVNTQQIRHIQSSTSISTPQNYGSQISQQQQNISTSLTTTTTAAARGQVERHVVNDTEQPATRKRRLKNTVNEEFANLKRQKPNSENV